MKQLNFKNIWLVILFILNDNFTNIKVVLPKDIKDDEITVAIGLLFATTLMLILILISIVILIHN